MGLLLGKRALARSALPAALSTKLCTTQIPLASSKFNFGASRQQLQESNHDDVTYVEYHRVLPVELQSGLHGRCAELLFARGVMW